MTAQEWQRREFTTDAPAEHAIEMRAGNYATVYVAPLNRPSLRHRILEAVVRAWLMIDRRDPLRHWLAAGQIDDTRPPMAD